MHRQTLFEFNMHQHAFENPTFSCCIMLSIASRYHVSLIFLVYLWQDHFCWISGTSAGMGTLHISKIREEFPDRMMCIFWLSTCSPEPLNVKNLTHCVIRNFRSINILWLFASSTIPWTRYAWVNSIHELYRTNTLTLDLAWRSCRELKGW